MPSVEVSDVSRLGKGGGLGRWVGDISLPLSLLPSLIFGLLGSGCASPEQRQLARDWALICEQAPLGPGASISAQEQRAMSRVGAWALSVEQVNARCASR